MMSSTFLQIFLCVNFLVIGALLTLAVQHAWVHFHTPKVEKPAKQPPQNGHLPPDVRKHMLEEAENNFETVIDKSAGELEQDLETTAKRMDQRLQKFGTDIISGEMEQYHNTLQKLRQQAEVTMNGAQVAISNHQKELAAKLEQRQADLEAELAAQIAAEKQQLIDQINTKLSDAVMAFLLETLQHNVDLGAQANYLVATLEEHKSELAKGLHDEA